MAIAEAIQKIEMYVSTGTGMYVSTGTGTRQRRKSESGSNRYYERPGYEATFLATLEQRTEIAIRVFVDIHSAFIRNACGSQIHRP